MKVHFDIEAAHRQPVRVSGYKREGIFVSGHFRADPDLWAVDLLHKRFKARVFGWRKHTFVVITSSSDYRFEAQDVESYELSTRVPG